jgi:hypothetical protein
VIIVDSGRTGGRLATDEIVGTVERTRVRPVWPRGPLPSAKSASSASVDLRGMTGPAPLMAKGKLFD